MTTAIQVRQTATFLIHGDSGAGKSWLGDTAPGPRLILDAEGGAGFTPSTKYSWDPMRENPPAITGNDSVIVLVRDFAMMQRIFQWINSGQHPFKSIVFDSLTEIQKRCKDNIQGQQFRQQDWGTLLAEMETMIRQYRDIAKMEPANPLDVAVFVTTSMTDNRNTFRPNVQGQLRLTLPQFVDVVGFLYTAPNAEGHLDRVLMTQPFPGYIAKDRTNALGDLTPSPNIERMMEVIYANN